MMRALARLVIAFFRFWYDFIVGDCRQIAAGVLVVLVAGALLSRFALVPPAVLAPLFGLGLAAVLVVSLISEVGRGGAGRS